MSKEEKPYIRAQAAVSAFTNWHLPQVGESSHVVGLQRKDADAVKVVEEELAAEKITVAELEAIREDARLEGLAAGLEEGRAQGKQEGLAQGLAEGKEQGYQEGFASGDAEIKRLQALLSQMLVEFETPLDKQLDDVENVLMEYVQAFSKAVINHELSTNPELIQQAIKEALNQLPEPLGNVKLVVAQADKSVVEAMLAQTSLTAEVVVDDAVGQGGFKIHTSSSIVEHAMPERFEHVSQQLTQLFESTKISES